MEEIPIRVTLIPLRDTSNYFGSRILLLFSHFRVFGTAPHNVLQVEWTGSMMLLVCSVIRFAELVWLLLLKA